MHGYVKDWKHLLRANVQQGQQVLRRLIKGRLRFEPRDDYYVFTGTGTLGPVVGSDLIHKVHPGSQWVAGATDGIAG